MLFFCYSSWLRFLFLFIEGTGADARLCFDKGRLLLKVFLLSNLSILAYIFKTLYNNEERYSLSFFLNTLIPYCKCLKKILLAVH